MTLRFTDGVEFDTSGDLRIESRHDGLYVVGAGMLIPIATDDEGEKFIQDYYERRLKKEEEK